MQALSRRKQPFAWLTTFALCLAALPMTLVPGDALAAKSKNGYPVCLYTYQNAGKQKIRKERSCFHHGGYGVAGAGGDSSKFSDGVLKQKLGIFNRPVQYVDLRDGWAAKLWWLDANGKRRETVMRNDGPIDIRRGQLRGVWVWDSKDYQKGYPVCIYTSKADMSNKRDGLCLRYGEYMDVELFGWSNNQFDWIDLRNGFKLELYRDVNWNGKRGTFYQTKDGRLQAGDIRHDVRSLRVVKN